MGRSAKGWTLIWKQTRLGRVASVRFRLNGVRIVRATGEKESAKATARAQAIYASAVGGRLQTSKRVHSVGRSLVDLCDVWLRGLLIDPDNVYETYAVHFIAHFKTFEGISSDTAITYAAARLKLVKRKTVLKELSALRGFLRWAKAAKITDAIPYIPIPDKAHAGTVSNPGRKTQRVDLSEAEALAVVRALPVLGKKWNGRARTPRAFFAVLWETGLRPKTIHRLEVGRHYTKGASSLIITADIDKAKYERTVDLTPEATQALDAVCPKKGLLFPRADYRKTLRTAALASGIDPAKAARISRYDYRHGATTHMVTSTGNLMGTAYQVGHKLVSTTDKYLHPTRDAGTSVVSQLSKPKRGAKKCAKYILNSGSKPGSSKKKGPKKP